MAGYVRRVRMADRLANRPVAQAQARIGWDWVEGTTPGFAAPVAQSPTGSASLGCAQVAPAGAPARKANRDRHRGSETYRKGTCRGITALVPTPALSAWLRDSNSEHRTYWQGSSPAFPQVADRKGSQVSPRTAEVVARAPASSHQPQHRSQRIRRRRAWTLLIMTLVLPGSAQLVAGNRRVGRMALRIWAALWLVAVLAVLLALLLPQAAFSMITSAPALAVIKIALIIFGLGWIGLLADAWRLANPWELGRHSHIGFSVITVTLAFTIFGGSIAVASIASAQHQLTTAVFSGGGDQVAQHGRLNILLMGGDAGPDRSGLRPDSMTVASVDTETGRTVLISLPRNLQAAAFPDTSPLHPRFPHGFRCSDGSCMLNAVYTYATEHRDLYPDVENPGAQATKEAVEGSTGLKINYWVLIDLKGFESLVNSVGGITMDVYRRVPIGGGSSKIYGYVRAGKNRHLDGREALWFARSRSDSSDYDRILRQKCVMRAMLNQLDPITVLTRFNKIAEAGREVVATDIPPSEIGTMMDLALKAKSLPVSSAAMVPPLINPNAPDFAVIHSTVQKAIDDSEAIDNRTQEPVQAGTPTVPSATPKPTPRATPSRSSQTDDLGKVCAA
jgi:polyisoprenyl-teichoic acid--peptidoglycan teichoic acid transferase